MRVRRSRVGLCCVVLAGSMLGCKGGEVDRRDKQGAVVERASAFEVLDQGPTDAPTIRVIARKWYWAFKYGDGPGIYPAVDRDGRQPTLVLPAGELVRLELETADELHTFAIGADVRVDLPPGKPVTLWLRAKPGASAKIECAQQCAPDGDMVANVEVVSMAAYDQRVRELTTFVQAEGESAIDFGRRAYEFFNCEACHRLDNSVKIGPGWAGLWGKRETLSDGSTVTIDADYIRESVLEPKAKVVEGFVPQMPSFSGEITDAQLDAVIALIESLG